jgi:hypothetical protein
MSSLLRYEENYGVGNSFRESKLLHNRSPSGFFTQAAVKHMVLPSTDLTEKIENCLPISSGQAAGEIRVGL